MNHLERGEGLYILHELFNSYVKFVEYIFSHSLVHVFLCCGERLSLQITSMEETAVHLYCIYKCSPCPRCPCALHHVQYTAKKMENLIIAGAVNCSVFAGHRVIFFNNYVLVPTSNVVIYNLHKRHEICAGISKWRLSRTGGK
jgi:hypothetical protein